MSKSLFFFLYKEHSQTNHLQDLEVVFDYLQLSMALAGELLRAMDKHQITFLLGLLVTFMVFASHAAEDIGDTISLGDYLTANQTRRSRNGTFEIGFFQPKGTTKWYVGIWYAQIAEQTVVWVANREQPLERMDGVALKLAEDGSQLVLSDGNGTSAWSGMASRKATKAVILDSGNFVMFGENQSSVWESFHYPGDTFLPGMKIGMGQKLNSWKNSFDPAPGSFTLELDPSGASQFVLLWNRSVRYWESGLWNGDIFSGLPEMATKFIYVFSVAEYNNKILYFTYSLKAQVSIVTRFVLDKDGEARLYIWRDEGDMWSMIWSQPTDQCQVYDFCGPYGVCSQNNVQFCNCIQGFEPTDAKEWNSQDWSRGCSRRARLQCGGANGSTDGFLELKGRSLRDKADLILSNEATSLQDCWTACQRNCSCTAFSFIPANPRLSSCKIWAGDLLTVHETSDVDVSLFVRVAASETADQSQSHVRHSNGVGVMRTLFTIGLAVLAVGLVLAVLFWWRWQRSLEKFSDYSLRMFSYRELQIATKNFSERLGSGGFGSVYKGTLADQTLVAVKALESSGSNQGEKQFRMEVSTIGTIQHVNLVPLRGFCTQGSRRMLVYEYMPNGSLNSFLFSRPKGQPENQILDWKTRYGIALGTARGILYLHDKCRDCIIHCDIKPENILLDANFCPKVSDFGLAKLVGRDFNHVLTTMRGTRGYLAPEWISGMPITAKADVYSFGMTLLEIIAGRRNLDFSVPSSRLFFPTWAGTQMKLGNVIDLLDAKLRKNIECADIDVEQVRRAAMIGGWCIQDDVDARPSMAHVVNVLEGIADVSTPPIPKSLLRFMEQTEADDGSPRPDLKNA